MQVLANIQKEHLKPGYNRAKPKKNIQQNKCTICPYTIPLIDKTEINTILMKILNPIYCLQIKFRRT